MRPVAWMVAASVASALVASLLWDGLAQEILLGMVAPLVAGGASWLLMVRAYGRDPRSLTALMIKAFAFKMVFFGAYVTAALNWAAIRPRPFVASFVAYFVALHLTEALCLRRLTADRLSVS